MRKIAVGMNGNARNRASERFSETFSVPARF